MMLLDVGNSSVNWALEGDGQYACRGYFLRHPGDFDELASSAWGHLPAPDRVAVANVAGAELQREISDWVMARWQLVPCYISTSAAAVGVVNAYAEPGKLGVDRWAALVAARAATAGPVCVIDCGSAITIDALDADGRHRGGLIAPGLRLMQQALSANTSDIGGLADADVMDCSLFATGTTEAVNNGVCYMASAMIDRVTADVVAELGERTVTLITGGDAARLLPLLAWQPRHEPDLVLMGVAILAREEQCVT